MIAWSLIIAILALIIGLGGVAYNYYGTKRAFRNGYARGVLDGKWLQLESQVKGYMIHECGATWGPWEPREFVKSWMEIATGKITGARDIEGLERTCLGCGDVERKEI